MELVFGLKAKTKLSENREKKAKNSFFYFFEIRFFDCLTGSLPLFVCAFRFSSEVRQAEDTCLGFVWSFTPEYNPIFSHKTLLKR